MTIAATYPLRASAVCPILENRIVQRGSGILAWNLTLDPPAAAAGYSSWVVKYEITSTVAGVTTLVFSETLSLIDAVNGVWQLTLTSLQSSTADLPLATYQECWWRSDLTPDHQLLRWGTLQLVGLEFQ